MNFRNLVSIGHLLLYQCFIMAKNMCSLQYIVHYLMLQFVLIRTNTQHEFCVIGCNYEVLKLNMIFYIFLIVSLGPMPQNNCKGHLRNFNFQLEWGIDYYCQSIWETAKICSHLVTLSNVLALNKQLWTGKNRSLRCHLTLLFHSYKTTFAKNFLRIPA